ncbi:hypothetical protein [Methanococcus maripaludis]|uniref:Uncharacterized protein n=1 Tax=Methanococcus maripaludis TaxID=39152 RepID=A0A8T3W043_METMI|nr:hypothetical protein [Methanococcus maripaludis]MBG0769571.1 hypothetical protein [Methanococcus maripaludis]
MKVGIITERLNQQKTGVDAITAISLLTAKSVGIAESNSKIGIIKWIIFI